MTAWDLHQCDERDADIFLARMPNFQSIIRGQVLRNRLPVVDILEAALSVYGRYPRGSEQAHFIITQVLGWHGELDE